MLVDGSPLVKSEEDEPVQVDQEQIVRQKRA